jgi:hypothetical protein
MSLNPKDIAEIDQAIAGATEEIDRLLWVLARLMEKNGDLQGYLDFGAFILDRTVADPHGHGGLLALVFLRLHEARGGAA